MSSPSYQISRGGKPVGTFELVQLRQMYDSGVLLPTDHAWTEGMKEWQTLSGLFPSMNPPSLPPRAPALSPAQPAFQPPQPGFQPTQPTAPNAFLALIVPIGRSAWAIFAGYLGLISILILPAPFAILCGVLAIKDINKNPHKLGLVRAWFGILSGSFCLLGLLIMVIFAMGKN